MSKTNAMIPYTEVENKIAVQRGFSKSLGLKYCKYHL